MSDQPFTEEDVETVALAVTNASGGVYDNTDGWARYVLEALAAAGRLLPPDAEHREEWAIRLTPAGTVIHVADEREAIRDTRRYRHAWPELAIVRREVFAGPWVEVDGSPTDA